MTAPDPQLPLAPTAPSQTDRLFPTLDFSRGKARIECDRLIVAAYGLGKLAHPAQRGAAIVVGADMLRI